MGFLDSFTGKSQRRDLEAGYGASQNMLREGRTAAQGALSSGLTAARSTIQPYMQSGQRGQTAYENTLGMNGAQARQQQFQTGYLDDPALKYREQQGQGLLNNLLAKYNAGGFAPNSGMAMSGAGRLMADRFDQDWGGYQDRLRMLGQQGQGLAQFGAGLEYGGGKDLADLEMGYANTSAGNRINYANALAASRSIPIQNMLQIYGTAANAMASAMGGKGGK
jgi:hypothetical protein